MDDHITSLSTKPYRPALLLNGTALLVQVALWLPLYAADRWPWLHQWLNNDALLVFWVIGIGFFATIFTNLVLLVENWEDYRAYGRGPLQIFYRRRLMLNVGASLFWAVPALWFGWIVMKSLAEG